MEYTAVEVKCPSSSVLGISAGAMQALINVEKNHKKDLWRMQGLL